MKSLNKNFTLLEKVILAIMIIVLLGLIYYYFVDRPVKRGIKDAEDRISECQMVIPVLESQIINYQNMKDFLDELKEKGGAISYLASYNNGKNEMKFLNKIMEKANDYSVNFSAVTKDNDLIRRNISLNFVTDSYEKAEKIITELTNCEYRCIISDVRFNGNKNNRYEDYKISVSCQATFYETMVEGKEDDGLPKDSE